MGAPGRASLASGLIGLLGLLAWAEARPPADPSTGDPLVDAHTQPPAGWARRGRGFAGVGWWPLAEAAPRDGVLRLRLEDPDDVDLTVLFRAQRDPEGGFDLGYGLGIAGGRVAFVAWNGIAFAPRGRGGKFPRRRAVEVVVTMLGPQVVADVYDDDGKHLTQARADRLTGGGALLGVFGGAAWTGGALTGVTMRPACVGGRKTRFSQYHVRKGNLVAKVDPEVEVDRAVRLDRRPSGLDVRTDATGLEILFCAGTPVLSLWEELPWKYVQGSFRKERDDPPRREGRGFVLGDAYPSPEQVEALLRAWHAAYPQDTRLEVLGQTHEGRPLLALAMGRKLVADDPRPAVLLNGTHHGDEPLSTVFVLDAIEHLLAGPERRLLNNAVVWAVPLVNPDGANTFFEVTKDGARKNGRDLDGDGVREGREGVDLNRNYPFAWSTLTEGRSTDDPDSRYYRGPASASEPEVQGMVALAERERFAASISFHSGTIALLVPYTTEGVVNPDPHFAWQLAEQMAERAGPHPQGRSFAVQKNLYPVDGVDQDWLFHRFGTAAYLIEGARWSPLTKVDRDAVLDAVRPMWVFLVDRAGWGPGIQGRVTFAGAPAPATVTLGDETLNAGEVWTARPRDGRFVRLLPDPGTHVVTVSAPGYATESRRVRVGRKPAQVTFELQPLDAAQ